jgi:hypothetical protein
VAKTDDGNGSGQFIRCACRAAVRFGLLRRASACAENDLPRAGCQTVIVPCCVGAAPDIIVATTAISGALRVCFTAPSPDNEHSLADDFTVERCDSKGRRGSKVGVEKSARLRQRRPVAATA